MQINSEQADELYTLLVQRIKAPDEDYLRWAFINAMVVLQNPSYRLNSALGIDASLCNTGVDLVLTTRGTLDRMQQRLVDATNEAIVAMFNRAIHIPIRNHDQRHEMPVHRA